MVKEQKRQKEEKEQLLTVCERKRRNPGKTVGIREERGAETVRNSENNGEKGAETPMNPLGWGINLSELLERRNNTSRTGISQNVRKGKNHRRYARDEPLLHSVEQESPF